MIKVSKISIIQTTLENWFENVDVDSTKTFQIPTTPIYIDTQTLCVL